MFSTRTYRIIRVMKICFKTKRRVLSSAVKFLGGKLCFLLTFSILLLLESFVRRTFWHNIDSTTTGFPLKNTARFIKRYPSDYIFTLIKNILVLYMNVSFFAFIRHEIKLTWDEMTSTNCLKFYVLKIIDRLLWFFARNALFWSENECRNRMKIEKFSNVFYE